MRRTVRSVSVGRKLRRQKHWALMLSSALATSTARNATAASAHEPSRQLMQDSGTSTQDSRVLPFNIPAGPLEIALAEFQRLTGMRVVLSNPDIATVQSPGVSG